MGNTDIGDSLRFYLDQPSVREAARQIGGNLLLLMPFGLLLPVVSERLRRLPAMAIAAVLLAFAVETVQGSFIPGRAFDIDDVIPNAAGIIAAFLIAGRRLAPRRRPPDRGRVTDRRGQHAQVSRGSGGRGCECSSPKPARSTCSL